MISCATKSKHRWNRRNKTEKQLFSSYHNFKHTSSSVVYLITISVTTLSTRQVHFEKVFFSVDVLLKRVNFIADLKVSVKGKKKYLKERFTTIQECGFTTDDNNRRRVESESCGSLYLFCICLPFMLSSLPCFSLSFYCISLLLSLFSLPPFFLPLSLKETQSWPTVSVRKI